MSNVQAAWMQGSGARRGSSPRSGFPAASKVASRPRLLPSKRHSSCDVTPIPSQVKALAFYTFSFGDCRCSSTFAGLRCPVSNGKCTCNLHILSCIAWLAAFCTEETGQYHRKLTCQSYPVTEMHHMCCLYSKLHAEYACRLTLLNSGGAMQSLSQDGDDGGGTVVYERTAVGSTASTHVSPCWSLFSAYAICALFTAIGLKLAPNSLLARPHALQIIMSNCLVVGSS